MMSSLLVSEIARVQTSKYANIGGLAILIFDYCITFQDEVQWTWSRPWNLTRVMFIISRYLPFAGCAFTTYGALGGQLPVTWEENVVHIIGIVAAEGLLLLRTWAFWQRSTRLLIGLLSYALVTTIAIVSVNRSPKQLFPGVASTPGYFESGRNGTMVYILLAAYEIVILILTAYKRFRDYGNFQSSIIETVYRDGMCYMLCIIAITVTNVIVDAAFPIAYSNMFDELQLVIHSVLASRILFRLRSSDDRLHETPVMMISEDIHFGQPSNLRTAGTGSEV